jgi:periplasmic divalent cation tolerance protein
MTPFCVVYITTPRGRAAKKITTEILKKRLAACVNIVPAVDSHYWWKGKIDFSKESLLIVKTKKALVKPLTQFVRGIHPYTVPEVIALPIHSGHPPYLRWLADETK